jgi:hypothetical protein
MKAGIVARLGASLALLAICTLARPASAGVLVDMSVADTMSGAFSKQVQVSMGQKVFFRVSALNTFVIPIVSVCDIPMLTLSVNGMLVPFSVKEILASGKMGSMTLVATCTRAGTFRVTAFVRFINPFTGGVSEVADTALVVCQAMGASSGMTTGSTGATGGKTGGTGGTDGSIGVLGGTGSMGSMGSMGSTGTMGGQQTGTMGGQQTGTMGGQQGGKKGG